MTKPQPDDRRPPLERMLEARSVAVVGASAREGSFGERMMIELLDGGFDGRIVPVNPTYDEVQGHACVPTIADAGEPVDLVLLGVSNARLEEQLSAAAEAGAASAVIFASGFEEPQAGPPPLTSRLATIARDAGMVLCGGNCMGFVNVEKRVRASGFFEPKNLVAGGVSLISHSGSAYSAFLHNDRGLRFNIVVSAGQEFVTTMADYLNYVTNLESTRVIGLFLETVRDVGKFRRALDRAAALDVPVVALKVGRELLTRELVEAHSGALAGEDGAYEALFDAHGVVRVDSLDEMADTLALFAGGRRASSGGLASIHDSGGERAMFIDLAAKQGVRFAKISPETVARLEEVLEPGLLAVNPLDAWGTGNDSDRIFTESSLALLRDPDTAGFAFTVDLTSEEDPSLGFSAMAADVFDQTSKPFAMLSNLSSAVDPVNAAILHDRGMPLLQGTETGLAAFRHLFELRDMQARPPLEQPKPATEQVRDRWRKLLENRAPTEAEALDMLSDYGVPVVPTRTAGSVAEAMGAANALGWPVALKTAEPGVHHKSEVGGVKLDLADEAAVRSAYEDLASRVGPRVVVAPMVAEGVEVALGVVHDGQFGPLVLAAAGGTLVEVLGDRALAFPPLDGARARALIDRLRIRRLLDGVRGKAPADIDGLCGALVRLSVLALELGDLIAALDVNPLIVSDRGCTAVDALVLPRS